MINQPLADWVKSEEAQGYSPQQLYAYLIQRGYNAKEVTEAINASNQNSKQKKTAIKKNDIVPMVLIGVIMVSVIGGLIFYLNLKTGFLNSGAGEEGTGINGIQGTKVEPDCTRFPDRLEACAVYKCQFVDSVTDKTLEKEITGYEGANCHYIEQMANNRKMECRFTPSVLKVIAQYYKDVASSKSGGVQKLYLIENKQVANPLELALTTKQCVITF